MQISERIKELMLEAGYASPELATRAIKLSELILADITYSKSEPVAWMYQWKYGQDKTKMFSTVRWPTSDVYQEWALGIIEPVPAATISTVEGRCYRAVLAKSNKRYNGAMPK
jgi:hypothetical protein